MLGGTFRARVTRGRDDRCRRDECSSHREIRKTNAARPMLLLPSGYIGRGNHEFLS